MWGGHMRARARVGDGGTLWRGVKVEWNTTSQFPVAKKKMKRHSNEEVAAENREAEGDRAERLS